jgi:arylsulfatase A-like enzyme
MPDRNVLFLMTDQHRTDALGCYGNPHARTPNLDRLAAGGTRFESAFTPSAICTPARTSLLTGQFPFRHGVLSNAEWARSGEHGVRLSFAFSRALRDAGYQVGLIGKWHVDEHAGPAGYGFDGPYLPGATNPVLHEEYQQYLRDRGLPPARSHDPVRGTLPGGRPGHLLAARLDQPVEATFEHFLADRAIALLRQYVADPDGRPFHLSLHFFGPHLPYVIPSEYYDLIDPANVRLPASFAETFTGKPQIQRNYSTYWSVDSFSPDEWRKLIAVYWGYGALIDYEIGRVLAALDESGVAERTAVFFTADHGEFTGAHRLNDKSPAMYDDIYRIPCLVRAPAAPAGRVDEHFVTLMDLTATILDYAGLDTAQVLDGRSVLPLARGESVPQGAPWRQSILGEFHGHHFAHQQRMLRTADYKLIVSPDAVHELYDLRADPAELHNRFEDCAYTAVRDTMCRQLHAMLLARGDVAFARWMLAAVGFVPEADSPLHNDLDAIAEEGG